MDGLPNLPPAYLRDPDIRALLARLAHGDPAEWKVESLARNVHLVTPVAGRHVPWDQDREIVAGVWWDERSRERERAFARRALANADRLLRDDPRTIDELMNEVADNSDATPIVIAEIDRQS